MRICNKIRTSLIVFMAVAGVLVLCSTVSAESVRSLGNPTGFVNDYANVISGSDMSRLTAICEDLERASGVELAIVTINTLDGRTVEDFAQDLFTEWGIGKQGSNNGVLILISIADHKWRVHTGYGIEGDLPDSLARRIMENEAVPAFRNDDYGGGLVAAATQIKDVLEGKTYHSATSTGGLIALFIPFVVLIIAGILIWAAVRIKCPRCGSRVKLTSDKEILESAYTHSGIRKKDYDCTVCHHRFSRMIIIPMLVASSGGSSGGGWGTGWSSGGSSSGGGWSSGGSSFGGFSGGSSGGGGASGGW